MSRPSFTAEELEQAAASVYHNVPGLPAMLTFAAQCVRDRVDDKRALAAAQLQLQHVTLTLEELLAMLRDVKSPQV